MAENNWSEIKREVIVTNIETEKGEMFGQSNCVRKIRKLKEKHVKVVTYSFWRNRIKKSFCLIMLLLSLITQGLIMIKKNTFSLKWIHLG